MRINTLFFPLVTFLALTRASRSIDSPCQQTELEPPKGLHPVLEEFKQLIESNPRVYLFFGSMFNEEQKQVEYINGTFCYNYHSMLRDINNSITKAPLFDISIQPSIMTILQPVVATRSGYAAFLDKEVNEVLGKILDAWAEFLQSPESASVLNNSTTGWFGETVLKELTTAGNAGRTNYTFEELYMCDPSAPHYGFQSWDDFFTRSFRDDVRPTASPDDDNVIANACESKPYNLQRNVAAHDTFWIKNYRYSILHMMANDPLAEEFIGGTIYQAFLSPVTYHRWHSPVSGRVVKAYRINGTYFSQPIVDGTVDAFDVGPFQTYASATATRQLVFIEADNPAIGLMAFLAIGQVEVSTCEMSVKEGDYVKKGDQLGMFRYGGSTHVLVFRPEVKVTGFPNMEEAHNIPVRSALAVVNP